MVWGGKWGRAKKKEKEKKKERDGRIRLVENDKWHTDVNEHALRIPGPKKESCI